jgi:hypothetical protein
MNYVPMIFSKGGHEETARSLEQERTLLRRGYVVSRPAP